MSALGLLLATMEPPPAIEEEFQDWNDTEHFPERRDCEGALKVGRYRPGRVAEILGASLMRGNGAAGSCPAKPSSPA